MGEIIVERDGAMVEVTLSHPERRNAVSVTMWRALQTHFEELGEDQSVRCIVVQGAEGHFSGGADILEFPHVRGTAAQVRGYHEGVIAPALAAIEHCMHPVVASIQGVCIGAGLEIAGRCDLRVCASSSRFGAPITRLGFPMAPDELAGVLALLGRAVTLELLLEGAIWDASEALRRGLVNRVVADNELLSEVRATALRVAAGAPLAARINKALVRRLQKSSEPLSESERTEAFGYADSHDHGEGVTAFLEGRPPKFLGR